MNAESAELADCPLTVLVTVGAQALRTVPLSMQGATLCPPIACSLVTGMAAGAPGIKTRGLSEEQRAPEGAGDSSIRIGDRLKVVPNHVCPCINLHDHAYVTERERVVDKWKAPARGKVS